MTVSAIARAAFDTSSPRWGFRYLMVRPDHFRVDYQINPFMDLLRQPRPKRAMAQWESLAAAIEAAGGRVETMPQRVDSPDMVYAMNLGLAVVDPTGARVVMSHMRYPERRAEALSAEAWFADHGFALSYIGRDGVGPHFEAGDALPFRGDLLVGYWPRTDQLALKHLAAELDVRVRGVRIAHPGMYHLDLAFCPLDDDTALVCPSALDAASARHLLDAVPEPIVLTEEQATAFAANAIVVGRTVIAPSCPAPVRRRLERVGFEVEVVAMDEFHKGGGSIRCLTNPLDIELGRDLDIVPGGEVVLAD
jgi:N-dimethylarginine dimethylaminohydrolase